MRAAVINRLVLDASITLAWCFEDEKAPYAEEILQWISADKEALVPAIWPLEVANALRMAERRKRITVAQTTRFLGRLSGFAIAVDAIQIFRAFDHILSQAREWNLTTYDAAYLELALREGLPLATLDEGLRKAAKAAGVPMAHL